MLFKPTAFFVILQDEQVMLELGLLKFDILLMRDFLNSMNYNSFMQ